jgi:hypothetical protein
MQSATGEGVRSFGATGHGVKAEGSASGSGTMPPTTTATTPVLHLPAVLVMSWPSHRCGDALNRRSIVKSTRQSLGLGGRQ